MIEFIFAPVSRVPCLFLNNGKSGSLSANFRQVINALTGQRGPLFWKMSTTISDAVLASFGHLRHTCSVVLPSLSVLQVTSLVSKAKLGSNVDSSFACNSPMRNAPGKAIVATAQIRRLSCVFLSQAVISSLNTNNMLGVMGSLPVKLLCLLLMPSLFSMPFRTNFTSPLLKLGGSIPFMMWSCRTPSR